jgi:hypothetical protein
VRLRAPPVLGHHLQVTAHLRRDVGVSVQLVLGEQARLDPLGQVHLLLGREQAGPANRLEVGVHRVAHRGRLVVQVNRVGERGDVSLNGRRGVVVELRVGVVSAGPGGRR